MNKRLPRSRTKLTLRRETLRRIDLTELAQAAGGTRTPGTEDHRCVGTVQTAQCPVDPTQLCAA